MKKSIFIVLGIFIFTLAIMTLPQVADASRGEVDYNTWGIGAGTAEERTGCTTYSGWINDSYQNIWHRYPRCDEVNFHLDHQTSRTRLEGWLQEIKKQRLAQNYGGNTFVAPPAGSTQGNVFWFLDHNGVAHKINDWPTLMSWGFLADDYYTMPARELGFWNIVIPKGNELQYEAGPYYQDVMMTWRNVSWVYSMPEVLKNEFLEEARNGHGFLAYTMPGIEMCDSSWGRNVYKYFDWSYVNTLNHEVRTDCALWGVTLD